MIGKAVRYRDFGPAVVSSLPPQEGVSERELAIARGRARAEGFAAGVEEAEARFQHENQALLSNLVAELEAMKESRESERRDVAKSAARIVSAFLGALSPSFAKYRVIDDVVAHVTEVLLSAPKDRLRIEIASESLERLSEALKSHDARTLEVCEFVANDELPADLARIHWSGGFDEIDAGASTRKTIEALNARLNSQEYDARPGPGDLGVEPEDTLEADNAKGSEDE